MPLGTVAEHIERIYRRAGSRKLWFVHKYPVPSGFHQFCFPNVFRGSKAGISHTERGENGSFPASCIGAWQLKVWFNRLEKIKEQFLTVIFSNTKQ